MWIVILTSVFGYCQNNIDLIPRMETKQIEFTIDETYYTRCNLRVLDENVITWKNYQKTGELLKVNTALVLLEKNGTNIVLGTRYTGKKYTLDAGQNADIYIQKYLTDEKLDLTDFSKVDRKGIEEAKVFREMSNEAVYIAMGPPMRISGGRTFYRTYNEIIKSDMWIYLKRKGGGRITVGFHPYTQKVNRIEGFWPEEEPMIYEREQESEEMEKKTFQYPEIKKNRKIKKDESGNDS